MYDPKTVISQLALRWEASYHEQLGTEELKRHLCRLLDEAQKKELNAVFATWPGSDLLAAIDCLDDMDDGRGCIGLATDKPITEWNGAVDLAAMQNEINSKMEQLCKKETERLLDYPEYLPNDCTIISDHPCNEGIITNDEPVGIVSEIAIDMKEEIKRKGGRPPGAKNKAPRPDKGMKRK